MNIKSENNYHVLIFGTSPSTGKGGISTAIDNIMQAFDENSVKHTYYCTHNDTKFLKFIHSFSISLFYLVRDTVLSKHDKKNTVAFLHVGPGASLARKLFLALFLKIIGIRVVTQYHSPKFFEYLENGGTRKLLIWLAKLSKVNIAISEYWEGLFKAYGFPRVVCVGNMAPSPDLTNIGKKDTLNEKVILTMCRLEEGKNVDSVVRALQLLPEKYRLIICGTGKQLNQLKILADALGINKRVTFAGWVSDGFKIELLLNAHVFCLPSEYESFGMGYIEAMSHGCPVIGREIAPIKSIIKNESLGSLWDGKNLQTLAKLIMKECENDNEQNRIVRKSYFMENFHTTSVINKLNAVFVEAIQK